MDGILVVNKPSDCTSHDVVSKIRRTYNIKKVGHTGTLDPLATGVLPILIGKGTKLSKYLINHDKEYISTIKLGIKTDTGDLEGKIIETKKILNVSKEEIEVVLNSFVGKSIQTPPIYSAIKINGKKLYEYARSGQEVEIPKRNIEIYKIELLEKTLDEIKFKVMCSKGTYIRSLCEDIAQKLNNIGTMSQLQRTMCGRFKLSDSINMNELQNINLVKSKIITAEELFADKLKIKLKNEDILKLINGVKLYTKNSNDIYKIYNENDEFIGLGQVIDNMLKREYIEKE